MIRVHIAVAFVSVVSAVGCSDLHWVPDPVPFPESTLLTAKSAEHWKMIAGEFAKDAAALPASRGRLIYVASSTNESNFARGYRALLGSRLVASGLTVATGPQGALEVRTDAQVLRRPAQITEIIVTTSLVDANRVLLRKADVYYIDDSEQAMFETPYRPRTKVMEVTAK